MSAEDFQLIDDSKIDDKKGLYKNISSTRS